jgi:hypothetical protein
MNQHLIMTVQREPLLELSEKSNGIYKNLVMQTLLQV